MHSLLFGEEKIDAPKDSSHQKTESTILKPMTSKHPLAALFMAAALSLAFASTAHASEAWLSHFTFKNYIKPTLDIRYPVKPWTAREKAIIIKQLKLIHQYAPGLIERTIAYGNVDLYRSRHNRLLQSPTRPRAALAMANPRIRIVIFSDKFFRYYEGKRKWYVLWGTIHELTHIIDVGAKIALTPRWNQLVDWRIRGYRHALKDKQYSPSQRLQIQRKYGLITNYAATNIKEALAEYTTGIVLSKIHPRFRLHVPVPDEIRAFVQKHFLSMPFIQDPSIPYFLKGQAYFIDKRDENALHAFDKAIQADPNFTAAYFHRASALMYLRQYKNAIQDYQKALSLNPGINFLSVLTYIGLGSAYERIQDYQASIEYLQKALRIQPKNGRANYLLAKTYYRLKDYNHSAERLNTAIQWLPKKSRIRRSAFTMLATIHGKQKDYSGAVTVATQGLKDYPKYAILYYLRAMGHYYLKQDKQALIDYQRALHYLQSHSTLKARIYYYMARIFHHNKHYQQAVEYYERVIATNPKLKPKVQRYLNEAKRHL